MAQTGRVSSQTTDFGFQYQGGQRDPVDVFCSTVLGLLRPAVRRAWISDRTTLREKLPVMARRAHLELLSPSAAASGGVTDVREVDTTDDRSWNNLAAFAPWSTHVLLSGSIRAEAGQDVLLIEDAGWDVVVRLHKADEWLLELGRRQGYAVYEDSRKLAQRRAHTVGGPTLSDWEFTQTSAPSFLELTVDEAHELAGRYGLQLRLVHPGVPLLLNDDHRETRITLYVTAGRVTRAEAG